MVPLYRMHKMNSLVDYAASGSVPVPDVAGLIARLESAEKGSQTHNGDVHRALFPDDLLMTDAGGVGPNARPVVRQPLRDLPHLTGDVVADCMGVPAYTTSLDAALALCERVLPGWDWLISQGVGEPATACMSPSGIVHGVEVTAATPALALCIAVLKAIHHGNEGRQAVVNKTTEGGE